MNSIPKVFAIVLNYNGKDCLMRCLESLYHSDYSNMEVVVVDNGSQDGSLESAIKKYPRFHFIKNSENIGFAAGNNVAIRFALEKMADYVFLLNNDAWVERSTVAKTVGLSETMDDAGLISPLIISGVDGSIWFSGGKILWKRMRALNLTNSPSSSPYPTEYATGCAVLIKKEVFKTIGLFDEKYFLYYEDADFSFRAKTAGFASIVLPDARAYHLEKSATKNKNKLYWLVLSGIIFFKKNSKGLKRVWVEFFLLARKIRFFFKTYFFQKDSSMNQLGRAFSDYKNILKKT